MNLPRLAIILLTVSTALTHISLLFPDVVFILNGLGYLGLLGALYLPIAPLAPYRRLIRRALIGYTALSVLLWAAFGLREPIGYINKLNELLLIALLIWEDRQAQA
jgi:hypothetical protein